MAARNTNTTQPTTQEVASEGILFNNAEATRKALVKTYREEKKVPMYLSPMYKPYFGNVMTVSLNGISIYFKVDGSTQMVPESFADEIVNRRMAIDAILTKSKKMGNVSENFESAPGELKLF